MNVVGVDPSLRCTAVAQIDGSVEHFPTGDVEDDRIMRMSIIVDWVMESIQKLDGEAIDLVVVEGYAYGATGRAVTKMAELGGILRYQLLRHGLPWVEVPSTSIKKYATGRGNVNKYAVMIAARERLGYMGLNDNEADALWLRAYGLAMVGEPVCELPKANRVALKGRVEDWEKG